MEARNYVRIVDSLVFAGGVMYHPVVTETAAQQCLVPALRGYAWRDGLVGLVMEFTK